MRPDFITEEQLARWDENINNDVELKEIVSENFAKSEELREVLYSSLWLYEEMTKMSISPFVIAASQHVLGQESFGNDPWEIAQSMRETYRQIKERENVTKTD